MARTVEQEQIDFLSDRKGQQPLQRRAGYDQPTQLPRPRRDRHGFRRRGANAQQEGGGFRTACIGRVDNLQPGGGGMGQRLPPDMRGAGRGHRFGNGRADRIRRPFKTCDQQRLGEIETRTEFGRRLAGLAIRVDDQTRQIGGQEHQLIESGEAGNLGTGPMRQAFAVRRTKSAGLASTRAMAKIASRVLTE